MRNVPSLIATSYQKSLESGRTTPGVFICEDANGNSVGEFVVKLRHKVDAGNAGMLRELVANLLADELCLVVPEPGIVQLQADLGDAIVEEKIAFDVKESLGLNYGSKNLTGGYMTWPNDKPVPPSLKQSATDVFAFDALIHNPDRRRDNPNLLWKSDQLALIDHESAFAFLLAIPRVQRPWLLSEQPYLTNHIFYQHLRHMQIDLSRMAGAIEAVSEKFWNDLEPVIPSEWKGTEFSQIRSHIESVQQHLEDFMNDIRRVLQ